MGLAFHQGRSALLGADFARQPQKHLFDLLHRESRFLNSVANLECPGNIPMKLKKQEQANQPEDSEK